MSEASALDTGPGPGDAVSVLLIMEDRETRRPVVEQLESAGYRVTTVEKAWEAVRQAGQDPPGMVLIDMRTRDVTDWNFIRDISLGHDIPVVLIAGDGSQDVALAFEVGADDCIADPLTRGEVLARMGEALRRRAERGAGAGHGTIRLGGMTISRPECSVTVSGRMVHLPLMEFTLLWELATNAGRVTTYETLIARLWGPGSGNRSNKVRVVIKNLRRKLGDDARSPRYIFTVPKAGYRMGPRGR